MNEIQEIEMAKARRRMEQMANREREPCWFCLGGSKIERQYIVSVGEKVCFGKSNLTFFQIKIMSFFNFNV